jgi:hypothetical protein
MAIVKISQILRDKNTSISCYGLSSEQQGLYYRRKSDIITFTCK